MLSHTKVFLQPGQAEANESVQGIAAHRSDAGKGLHALEVLFCTALLFTVVVPALTKKKPKKQKPYR